MFRTKTLFIVGAGASSEVGLPLGSNLIGRVAQKLDIQIDRVTGRILSGDSILLQAIRNRVASAQDKGENFDPTKALNLIVRAVHQSISIDNFLDAHRDDPVTNFCGKLGIAREILKSERDSKIFVDQRKHESMNFKDISSTWFNRFFQVATKNISKADVKSIFENVSVISFNYDRTLEYFLPIALKNYYDLQKDDACSVVSGLKVIHPYGTVGYLPWQDRKKSVPFGGSEDADELISASAKIRTFTEQISDQNLVMSIYNEMVQASTLVFLGFAFYPLNMKLLTSGGRCRTNDIFATVKGISSSDCEVLAGLLQKLLGKEIASSHIRMNDMTCGELFVQHRLGMSS